LQQYGRLLEFLVGISKGVDDVRPLIKKFNEGTRSIREIFAEEKPRVGLKKSPFFFMKKKEGKEGPS